MAFSVGRQSDGLSRARISRVRIYASRREMIRYLIRQGIPKPVRDSINRGELMQNVPRGNVYPVHRDRFTETIHKVKLQNRSSFLRQRKRATPIIGQSRQICRFLHLARRERNKPMPRPKCAV